MDPVLDKTTVCSDPHDPTSVVAQVQEHLLAEASAARIADIFSALGDPTRVRIIALLAEVEMCVGDICAVLDMSQPAVSHHLRLLRNLRIVSSRKDGRHVFYTLTDGHIHDIFSQSLAHVEHD